VACLYQLEVQKRPGLAGLALAAAINVKIIPALLFLPLLATQRTKRDAGAFALGTACAALPFAVAWMGAGNVFLRNVFAYDSNLELWGLQAVFHGFRVLPGVGADEVASMAAMYQATLGRPILIVGVVLLAVYGYRRWLSPSRLMAATFCLFLAVTPAFGVQYTVYLVAPLMAVSFAWALRYDLLAGLYILLVYLHFRRGDWFPLRSWHTGDIPAVLAPLGLLAWTAVVWSLVVCLRGSVDRDEATN
jgi:hypothetical protein